MAYAYERLLIPMTVDLLTKGHIFLIEEALRRSRMVLVLITSNVRKAGQIVLPPDGSEGRLDLLKRAFANHPDVDRIRFRACVDQPLSDILLEEGVFTLACGIRDAADEADRAQQEALLKRILPGLAIVGIETPEALCHVSSSAAKGYIIQGYAEATELAASPHVVAMYRNRLCGELWFSLTRDPGVPQESLKAFLDAWHHFVVIGKSLSFIGIDLDSLLPGTPPGTTDQPWLKRAHADRLVRKRIAEAKTFHPGKGVFVCVTGGNETDRQRWDGGLTLHLTPAAPTGASPGDAADNTLSTHRLLACEARGDAGERRPFTPRAYPFDLAALVHETYAAAKLWHKEGRLP